jgi:hypothetical protein
MTDVIRACLKAPRPTWVTRSAAASEGKRTDEETMMSPPEAKPWLVTTKQALHILTRCGGGCTLDPSLVADRDELDGEIGEEGTEMEAEHGLPDVDATSRRMTIVGFFALFALFRSICDSPDDRVRSTAIPSYTSHMLPR